MLYLSTWTVVGFGLYASWQGLGTNTWRSSAEATSANPSIIPTLELSKSYLRLLRLSKHGFISNMFRDLGGDSISRLRLRTQLPPPHSPSPVRLALARGAATSGSPKRLASVLTPERHAMGGCSHVDYFAVREAEEGRM